MLPCSEEVCAIPLELGDVECVVRVAKSPFHFKNGNVDHRIFHPAPGTADVSVIRQVMGDDFCADKSREISANLKPPAEYRGLLVVTAGTIREVGSEVYDDREGQFCGHAHVNHGVTAPEKGKTWEPAERQKLDERCKALIAKKKAFEADSIAAGPGWKGVPLGPSPETQHSQA